MHLTIGIAVLLASLKWAKWKEWERYYPTLLYIVVSNLLYKFFAISKFHLWKLSSKDFFFNSHIEIIVWHIFIINTLLTFIYLSNFPEEDLKKKIFYLFKWVLLLIVLELLLLKLNHINYYHGWSLGWTIFFDVVMFSMLRLHYRNPMWAIILSIPITIFYLIIFDYF